MFADFRVNLSKNGLVTGCIAFYEKGSLPHFPNINLIPPKKLFCIILTCFTALTPTLLVYD